jgi:hypothetical protein
VFKDIRSRKMSRKSKSDYERNCWSYRGFRELPSVFWMQRRRAMNKNIYVNEGSAWKIETKPTWPQGPELCAQDNPPHYTKLHTLFGCPYGCRFHLVTVYLTALSVSRAIKRQMVGWLLNMIMNWAGCGRKGPWNSSDRISKYAWRSSGKSRKN